MAHQIADVLDELAGDFKSTSRAPTTGATESHILGTLAQTFVKRAALLRRDAQDAADAEERRRAAAEAEAERTRAAGQPAGYDPAEHTINEVNDHLRAASPEERARVLDLESQDRPEVPDSKKQRTGILAGPFGQQ